MRSATQSASSKVPTWPKRKTSRTGSVQETPTSSTGPAHHTSGSASRHADQASAARQPSNHSRPPSATGSSASGTASRPATGGYVKGSPLEVLKP